MKIGIGKNFLLRNIVSLFFAVLVIIGIFISKQTPYNIMNGLVQSFTGYSLLVLSLLIPVMAGMGINFSIVIGAIAGQLGIIMAVNWKLSGIFCFLTATLFATLFALLFGALTGLVLNKARGHEMITSVFVGYLGNSIYSYILLALLGAVIPITSSELLLSSGVGLKNAINLNGTLLHSVDGLLQVRFFLILMILGLLYLGFTIYYIIKKDVHLNKTMGYTKITISSICVVLSVLIMYSDVLPKDIKQLSNINFPVITSILICTVAVFSIMFTRAKLEKDFTLSSLNQQNPIDSKTHISKLRISAITISTIVAAWGQIILLQNTGQFSTYGSHTGVGFFAVAALVVGGATISKATVRNALLGILLLQGFYMVTIPSMVQYFSLILSESLRVILIYGAIIYAFMKSKRDNQME